MEAWALGRWVELEGVVALAALPPTETPKCGKLEMLSQAPAGVRDRGPSTGAEGQAGAALAVGRIPL